MEKERIMTLIKITFLILSFFIISDSTFSQRLQQTSPSYQARSLLFQDLYELKHEENWDNQHYEKIKSKALKCYQIYQTNSLYQTNSPKNVEEARSIFLQAKTCFETVSELFALRKGEKQVESTMLKRLIDMGKLYSSTLGPLVKSTMEKILLQERIDNNVKLEIESYLTR